MKIISSCCNRGGIIIISSQHREFRQSVERFVSSGTICPCHFLYPGMFNWRTMAATGKTHFIKRSKEEKKIFRKQSKASHMLLKHEGILIVSQPTKVMLLWQITRNWISQLHSPTYFNFKTPCTLLHALHPLQSLVVANGGLGNGVNRAELFAVLKEIGEIEMLVMIPHKPYAFVTYRYCTY